MTIFKSTLLIAIADAIKEREHYERVECKFTQDSGHLEQLRELLKELRESRQEKIAIST